MERMSNMSEEIEREFKNIITKDEFNLLLNTFHISIQDFVTQKNHYFDTQYFTLKEKSAALRIRELPGYYELTLKRKSTDGVIETNQIIDHKEVDFLLTNNILPIGEVNNTLIKLGVPVQDLVYFGSLTTDRAELEYKGGKLVFDHSHYLGIEDYELEYEVTDWELGKSIFTNLLNRLNISPRPTDTKVGRLYHAKLDIMKQSNKE